MMRLSSREGKILEGRIIPSRRFKVWPVLKSHGILGLPVLGLKVIVDGPTADCVASYLNGPSDPIEG
jgi:hypothetical protein